jgi:hypothetical protein
MCINIVRHFDEVTLFCSLQGFIFSAPCHAVFAFLNPLLIAVIQVKFQGTNQSPFQTSFPSSNDFGRHKTIHRE